MLSTQRLLEIFRELDVEGDYEYPNNQTLEVWENLKSDIQNVVGEIELLIRRKPMDISYFQDASFFAHVSVSRLKHNKALGDHWFPEIAILFSNFGRLVTIPKIKESTFDLSLELYKCTL